MNLAGVKLQRRMVKRLTALVWLAAQDVAEKNKDSSYTEYAAATLAGLVEIHRDTWYDSYSHRWMILKEIQRNSIVPRWWHYCINIWMRLINLLAERVL